MRESPRSDRRSGRRNPSAGIGPAGGGVRRQGGAGLAVCGLPSGRRGRGKERKTDSPVRAVSAQAGESVSFRRGESTALRIAARDARETAVLVDERLLSAVRTLIDMVFLLFPDSKLKFPKLFRHGLPESFKHLLLPVPFSNIF